MEDLISRDVALNNYQYVCDDIKCCECPFQTTNDCRLERFIRKLPVVLQVRHGKWIKISDRNYRCSCCKAWWSVDRDSTMKDYKYCPNCGASLEIYEDEA